MVPGPGECSGTLRSLQGQRKKKKYATQRKKYSYLDLPKGCRLVPKRSLKGFNSPYFLGSIGTPWKVFHKFLLSTGERYLVFFHHFHLNSASCWWDSYWTLHPRGSRPSPHNVVRCAELSTLTNWNALFPHFHRSLTLACQPHASSQYSHSRNSSKYIDYSPLNQSSLALENRPSFPPPKKEHQTSPNQNHHFSWGVLTC